jgi:hypothetical protein
MVPDRLSAVKTTERLFNNAAGEISTSELRPFQAYKLNALLTRKSE